MARAALLGPARPAGALAPLARAHLGFSPKWSNPRYQSPGITIFETVPFNRSGTPPRWG